MPTFSFPSPGFTPPTRLRTQLVDGRDLRDPINSIGDVILAADGECYVLRRPVTTPNAPSFNLAFELLEAHAQAGSVACSSRADDDNFKPHSRPYAEHLSARKQRCACGQEGAFVFSFAEFTRGGAANIEYTCVHCGNECRFVYYHAA